MLVAGCSEDKAEQIAKLLNEFNFLPNVYTAYDIIHSKALYCPIVIGNLVLASVAVEKLNFLLTEVKHLTVSPNLRGLGIGKRLISIVISKSTTPYIIASVRADNNASLSLFTSLGFTVISEVKNKANRLKVIGRPRELEIEHGLPAGDNSTNHS